MASILTSTPRQRNLRSRIESITHSHLLLLFSCPLLLDRLSLITKWFHFRNPIPISTMENEPTTTISTTINTDLIISDPINRSQRIQIITDMIYYLIEITYSANFFITAIHTALIVFLDTHLLLCRNPIPDIDIELKYFRHILFSTMTPSSFNYLPLLSFTQGKLVYEYILSCYFRHYPLYKHIFTNFSAIPSNYITTVEPPNNSLCTSLDGLSLCDNNSINMTTIIEPSQPFINNENDHNDKTIESDIDNDQSVTTATTTTITTTTTTDLLNINMDNLPNNINIDELTTHITKLRHDWNNKLDIIEAHLSRVNKQQQQQELGLNKPSI